MTRGLFKPEIHAFSCVQRSVDEVPVATEVSIHWQQQKPRVRLFCIYQHRPRTVDSLHWLVLHSTVGAEFSAKGEKYAGQRSCVSQPREEAPWFTFMSCVAPGEVNESAEGATPHPPRRARSRKHPQGKMKIISIVTLESEHAEKIRRSPPPPLTFSWIRPWLLYGARSSLFKYATQQMESLEIPSAGVKNGTKLQWARSEFT